MTLPTPIGNHATGFALCLCCRRWAYSSGILSGGNAFISNHSARCKGGCFHLPSRASGLGQKRRKNIRNCPLGAGSQLDSLSLPGESCWKKRQRVGYFFPLMILPFATTNLHWLRHCPAFAGTDLGYKGSCCAISSGASIRTPLVLNRCAVCSKSTAE